MPPDELVDGLVAGQHVLQGVGLALDPEPVLALHVGADAVGRGLARADDDLVVIRRGHRPGARRQAPGEEVVPRGEAPVLVVRVVLVVLDADRLSRRVALPPGRRVVEDVAGVGAVEELAPRREDLLQRRVDPGVAVGGETGRGAHRPVQDGAERQRHRLVPELGRDGQHLVDQPQHLLDTGQVPLAVVPVARDLLDHPLEVHAHDGVAVDELLELDDHRVQRRVLATGLGPLPMPLEPGLQIFLRVGEPPGTPSNIITTNRDLHARQSATTEPRMRGRCRAGLSVERTSPRPRSRPGRCETRINGADIWRRLGMR